MATFPSDSIRTKNWGDEILTDADLEGQLDVIHNYIQAALNSTTGHDHDGTSNQGPKIGVTNLTVPSQAAADLIVASSSSAWKRLGKGTALQVLRVNSGATDLEWGDASVTWDKLPDGVPVQVVNTMVSAKVDCSTAMPEDDTIPQNTEGDECMTLAVTPKATTNKLKIEVVVNGYLANAVVSVALFQDSTANALAAVSDGRYSAIGNNIKFTHYMAAGTTSSTTFKVRCGPASGTFYFNGGNGTRKFGGVCASSITITEIKAS